MKGKLMVILVASVAGGVGGMIGSNLIKPAYAASNVIEVHSVNELITKCDFSKTIVAAGATIVCVQK